MRFQLDPFSPTGVSVLVEQPVKNVQSNGYLGEVQLAGLLTAGTNVTITGNGNKQSPFVVNSSGGGGGGSGDMVLASVQTNTAAKTFNAGTLLDKGEIVFDVKAYGATGNGVTDDATNVQSAITAAQAVGGVVYFPPGTYLIGTALSFTGRMAIRGASWDSKIKAKAALNDYIIKLDGVYDNRGYIQDIEIDGNCTNSTGGGISAPGAVESTFFNVHFTNCYDWGLKLSGFVSAAFGHHNRVQNCLFDLSAASAGIGGGILMSSSDENFIKNNDFAYLGGATTPIAIKDSSGLQLIQNNVFVGSQGGTINVVGVQLESGDNSSVIGNTFDGVGGTNILAKGANHIIANNRFVSIGDQGSGTANGIELNFGNVRNLVTGNYMASATTNGKAANLIKETAAGGTGDNMIIGNVLKLNGTITGSVLSLAAGSSPLAIAGFNIGTTTEQNVPYIKTNGGGSIIGNLEIEDAATSTKSYRFRTNGSNLDMEFSGADAYISDWSGANYTGTQRYYLRLESGANIAHAIGSWQFASSAFAAAGVTIDGTAGTGIFTGDVTVPDEVYDATNWNGNLEVPTKNAVRDKIEAMLGSSGITRSVTVTSGNYTAGSSASTDYVYLIAGAHTTTLPTASGNTNRYTFKNNHSAAVTINRAGSDTIEGATSLSIPVSNSVDLISDGTSAWSVI